MRAMATGTRGHVRIAASEPLAMDTRGVLGGLIDALFRCVPPHQVGIAVALRADGDDVRAARGATESAAGIVRDFGVSGFSVAAMTVDACKAARPMDVLALVLGRRRR